MKYLIINKLPGSIVLKDINEDESSSIASLHTKMWSICRMEDAFDNIVENFIELNETYVNEINRNKVYVNADVTWLWESMKRINRRISNFLGSYRSYIDQTNHDLHQCFNETETVYDLFKKAQSAEFDNNHNYRIMSKLRNYTQHFGIPVDGIGFNNTLTDADNLTILSTVTPRISKDSLLKSDDWGKIIRKDIENINGEYLDVKELIHDGMAGLIRIHSNFRDLTKDITQKMRNDYKSYLDMGRAHFTMRCNNHSLDVVESEYVPVDGKIYIYRKVNGSVVLESTMDYFEKYFSRIYHGSQFHQSWTTLMPHSKIKGV